mgnify:CR=1 FL=1
MYDFFLWEGNARSGFRLYFEHWTDRAALIRVPSFNLKNYVQNIGRVIDPALPDHDLKLTAHPNPHLNPNP